MNAMKLYKANYDATVILIMAKNEQEVLDILKEQFGENLTIKNNKLYLKGFGRVYVDSVKVTKGICFECCFG